MRIRWGCPCLGTHWGRTGLRSAAHTSCSFPALRDAPGEDGSKAAGHSRPVHGAGGLGLTVAWGEGARVQEGTELAEPVRRACEGVAVSMG